VKPGEAVRYFAGGGWDKSGDFADAVAWNAYLAAFAARLRAPLRVTLAEAP
jgi:GH18 family chitinase